MIIIYKLGKLCKVLNENDYHLQTCKIFKWEWLSFAFVKLSKCWFDKVSKCYVITLQGGAGATYGVPTIHYSGSTFLGTFRY